MPVVPLLTGTDVGTRPLPVPRVSPEMFGAAPNVPDTSGLADVAHAIWQEQKRKSDQVAVLGAATQVSDLETNLATETRARRGLNAYSAPDDVAKAWTEGTSKIGATLTNDDQRLAFQNVVASHGTALHALVQEHVAQQHKVVDDENTQGYTAAEANAAVQNYTDPIRIAEAVANTSAAIRAHGQRNGVDPALTNARVAAQTSQIHTSVIDRLLANDQDLAAKSYYTQYKDTIDAQQLPALDKALDLGSSRVASQQEADRIMKTATTRGEALDLVDQIENPKVQDLARQRVTRLWAQKEDNQREVAAQVMQYATDIVRQTGDFNRIPPSMLVGMSVTDQRELLNFANLLNKNVPVKTALATYNALEHLLSDPAKRDQALKMDLNSYVSQLSDADFRHFSELQSGLQKGDEATVDRLQRVQNQREIVSDGLRSIGVIGDTKTNIQGQKPDPTLEYQLRATIDRQILDVQKHTKRPATEAEITDITNTVLTRHLTQGGAAPLSAFQRAMHPIGYVAPLPAPLMKRFDQMRTGDLVINARDIPVSQRQLIDQDLQRLGLPLTPANILKRYNELTMSLRPQGGARGSP